MTDVYEVESLSKRPWLQIIDVLEFAVRRHPHLRFIQVHALDVS